MTEFFKKKFVMSKLDLQVQPRSDKIYFLRKLTEAVYGAHPPTREGGGSLRPPGAAAPPKKSETAVLVVSASNGDTWRLILMATA